MYVLILIQNKPFFVGMPDFSGFSGFLGLLLICIICFYPLRSNTKQILFKKMAPVTQGLFYLPRFLISEAIDKKVKFNGKIQ